MHERRQKWQKTVDQLPTVTDDCVDESDLSVVEQCDCAVGYFAEVLAMERKPEFVRTLRDFEKSVMKKAAKTEEGAELRSICGADQEGCCGRASRVLNVGLWTPSMGATGG